MIISGTLEGEDIDPLVEASAEVEIRQFEFSVAQHGMRLDRALVDLVPEFSRNYLQQLIELGFVRVNAQVAHKPAQKVKAFEVGSIELRPTPQSQAFKAEDMNLDVVYQDPYLMVINKPAGMVVHPAPGNWSGTLMNGLLGLDAQAFHLPRAGIVHRLDKDTSGLMVVARTRTVMDALVKAIAAREVKRQYLALAHGRWLGESHRVVNAPIGRDPGNRLRMAVVDLDVHAGKTAQTDVDLIANGVLGCLVKCTLHTGRTHQIRVHMASLSHPLVADSVYGGAPAAGMLRQALHAFHLAFLHPVTNQALNFSACLPADFSQALNAWGLQYNQPILSIEPN
ncbi:MAG: 23S rRNA pseudouridine synthase [Comamonadaceae bacterium]|nr:MAG: 23S rRNA pseudouridine synthase [Comamonadaceae bacterium]